MTTLTPANQIQRPGVWDRIRDAYGEFNQLPYLGRSTHPAISEIQDWFQAHIDLKYLEQAIKASPADVICGHCGGPNIFVDDCGFFYVLNRDEPLQRDTSGHITNKPRVACQACYRIHQPFHASLYGQGDR